MADNPADASDQDRRVRRHPVLGDLPAARSVRIVVGGRTVRAREGETIAAALLAAGQAVFRTDPATGEARGLFCGVGRCPDCAVIVDGEADVRACLTPVRDGMRVEVPLERVGGGE